MAKALKKKITFSLAAPQAETVALVGDFTGWEKNPVTLTKQKDGRWTAVIPLAAGEHEYRFLVDGEWRDDPECGTRRQNPFGAANCVRVIA